MARIATDPNYSSPTFPRATAGTDVFLKEDVQALAAAVSTHVHDGAGKGLAVSGPVNGSQITDGTVTSAKILDGTIATADIAANAVTQSATSSSASGSTASTSAVDTGLTLTLTTTGGPLLLTGQVVSSNSGTGTVDFNLALDGAPQATLARKTTPAAGQINTCSFSRLISAPAPGSHTYKIQYLVNTGTETIAFGVMTLVEFKR